MTKEFKKRWSRDHARKIELIRDAMAAKRQVWNRHFGLGRIVEEWGAFESQRLGPNEKALRTGYYSPGLGPGRKCKARKLKKPPPNKHISGAGVFDVIFDDGQIHPINADNLLPA